MSIVALLVLAVGLAMDSAAAAATIGFAARAIQARQAVRVAALFGGFHVAMPLCGWLLGNQIGPAVAAWDHWIAFVLLVAIGGKMIYEALCRDGDGAGADADAAATNDPFALRVLIGLVIATSIDAFAAGITLPLMDAPLLVSIAVIGATAAALSVTGLWLGRRFGARLGRRLDILGGALLIALGAKTLVQHLLDGV